MKRTTTAFLAIAATVLAASCARQTTTNANDSARAYFEAWIAKNCPDAVKTGLGIYMIKDTVGTGETLLSADAHPYILADYTMKKLDGTITGTTYESVARQWGKDPEATFFGPTVLYRTGNNLNVGIEEGIRDIKAGGHRIFAVPGWLMTRSEYDSAGEYFTEVTGGTPMIYDITVRECISDITQWETDSIARHMARQFGQAEVTVLEEGKLYYICTKKCDDGAEAFTSGDKVFINYTGSLLNGRVFDTTDEKTAWDNGIHSEKTYSTVQINWAAEYGDITMGTSSTKPVEGFSHGISGMKLGEKGIIIMHSDLGYKSSGQGGLIPGFSPLRFDIEIVESE